MKERRFGVCYRCLRDKYGGVEKSCTHWKGLYGMPKGGACSECGGDAIQLHCPDGSRTEVQK